MVDVLLLKELLSTQSDVWWLGKNGRRKSLTYLAADLSALINKWTYRKHRVVVRWGRVVDTASLW